MKHRIALAAALVIGIVAAPHAQTARQSIIVLPVFHGSDFASSLAEQIRASLVSRLMEQGGIEIVAQDRVEAVALEGGFDLKADDERVQLELAKKARADFIVSARASRSAAKGTATVTVTVRLLSKDTGKDLYGKDTSFAEAALVKGMSDLAKRLGVAIRQRADLSVDQIDAFIRAKDWDNAERYLDLYLAAKPAETAAMAERRAKINVARAAIRYADAQKAAELYLYEEAIRAAREATELDPRDETYAAYLSALQDAYANFLAESVEDRLDRVEGYVDARKYEVGKALLDKLKASAPLSSRGRLLEERCRKGIAAREKAHQAKTYLENGKYGEALASVDEALALVPDDAEYLKLRLEVVKAEKRDAAGRERFSLYLDELRSYDYRRLFVSRKKPDALVHAVALATTIDAYDHTGSADDGWVTDYVGPVLTIEGRYERPFPLTIPMPFSFTGFDLCWYGALRGGGGVARGTAKDPVTGTVTALLSDTVVDANLAAGVAARLTVLSYVLRLEADLGTGPFFFARSSRAPFSGSGESVDDEFSWLVNLSFGGSISWMPTDGMHVGFQVSKRLPLNAPSRELCDKPRFLSLGATIGFDL